MQASKDKDKWVSMTIFRIKQLMMDIKFKNETAFKFWRFVLVDHSSEKQSWFKGIGWYIKPQKLLDSVTSEIDTSDLIFNST